MFCKVPPVCAVWLFYVVIKAVLGVRGWRMGRDAAGCWHLLCRVQVQHPTGDPQGCITPPLALDPLPFRLPRYELQI